MKLVLEQNEKFPWPEYEGSKIRPGIIITPPLSDEYWLFRVKVSKKQAVIGFPKFFVIGIGFQQEQNWNTNLPSSCGTETIYNHIRKNKGSTPKKSDCLEAIRMIQVAAKAYMDAERAKIGQLAL